MAKQSDHPAHRSNAPATGAPLSGGKTVLIVLFVPSADRNGTPLANHQSWVDQALEMFGTLFGGATAFTGAMGIWRDDRRGGRLVRERPAVVHCYAKESDAKPDSDRDTLDRFGAFCRRMGRETGQGEVGFVYDNSYLYWDEDGLAVE